MRMPLSKSTQVTIEKSPCYISEPLALQRIQAMNNSMKLIVIVRDPITRILSEHSHYKQVCISSLLFRLFDKSDMISFFSIFLRNYYLHYIAVFYVP